MFFSPAGDHYRTRLTHTLEVSQIARTIAKVLRLHEELTEAIALGHDLGHTPFGHAGERVLSALVPGEFNHYEQSLRIVDVLENDRHGLNLTWEVRDGIARHSKGKSGLPVGAPPEHRASTIEGQIARVADIIAYVNHDTDDAIRAGLLRADQLPPEAGEDAGPHAVRAHRPHGRRRGAGDAGRRTHGDSDERADPAGDARAAKLPVRIGLRKRGRDGGVQEGRGHSRRPLGEGAAAAPASFWIPRTVEAEGLDVAAQDFLAGMTDRYAVSLFEQLFIPKPWVEVDLRALEAGVDV